MVKSELNNEDIINRLWRGVVTEVTRLISTHERFGFVQFRANLNPTLPEILQGLHFVNFALSQLAAHNELSHDEVRDSLNAQQCIIDIRRLAMALEQDDQTEYDAIIATLKNQAKI